MATRAPVEENYYRARRQEAGATRVAVDAEGREDEAQRIPRRNGGRDLSGNGLDQGTYGTDTATGALT